jgi:hypothetical protein
VAEVDLDLAQVLPLLEQMGRGGMAQRLPILHMSRFPRRSSIATTPATGWR